MGKTRFLASLISILILASAAAMVYAQSAEDLVKGQSPGITYVNNGGNVRKTVTIAGDQIIWNNSTGVATFNILSKRKEGNTLIIETDGAADGRIEFFIYGSTLNMRMTNGSWGSGVIFERQ